MVVKLTADAEGEPPSAMRVVGAGGGRHFHYGPSAGASACFKARLYHASVAPTSAAEHLKMAFFFRSSSMGDRRGAKRAASGTPTADSEPTHSRKRAVAALGAAAQRCGQEPSQ